MLVWHGTRSPKPYTKNREVPGPAPYSTGIIARPSRAPRHEILNQERRKREDALLELMKRLNADNRTSMIQTWVDYTGKRFEKNYVQDRVNDALNSEEIHLDKKRLKLRNFLRHEENQHLVEMESLHETPEQRFEKQKNRAAELKSRREAERLKLVEEKREMQFIGRCEEIRPILSRRQTEQIFRDRGQQIATKAQLARREQEVEAMYAEMWEQDRLAKAAREEKTEQLRVFRMQDQLSGLNVQKAANQLKKAGVVQEKAEELKLIDEENAIIQLEKERAYQQKKQQQYRTRNQLESMMRYKVRQEMVRRQEELALDMKILEQCLEESRNEKLGKQQQKDQMRQETLQYLAYLKEQAALEKSREKELDLMLDFELKAMWDKRVAQFKIEKQSRDKLMKEVMEVRKLQIAEKLQRVAQEQEEIKRDRITMSKMIEEHQKDEDERVRAVHLKNNKHASDLIGQMAFEQEIAERKRLEEQREYEDGQKVEAEFQAKMKKILLSGNDTFGRTHPLRRNMEEPQHPFMDNNPSLDK